MLQAITIAVACCVRYDPLQDRRILRIEFQDPQKAFEVAVLRKMHFGVSSRLHPILTASTKSALLLQASSSLLAPLLLFFLPRGDNEWVSFVYPKKQHGLRSGLLPKFRIVRTRRRARLLA